MAGLIPSKGDEVRPLEHGVLQAELSVSADSPAERCGHCRIVSPLVEELADDNEGRENERR